MSDRQDCKKRNDLGYEGDICMLFLKNCPECHSELENNLFTKFQYCPVCGYWTRKETARLEPLIILE
jgi:hypothetical protein